MSKKDAIHDAPTIKPARDNSGGKDQPGRGVVVAETKYNTEKGGMTGVKVRSGVGGWIVETEETSEKKNG